MVETWEPRFTFHGFRSRGTGSVTARSSWPRTASRASWCTPTRRRRVRSSVPTRCVNQLQHNIQWGQRGNFLEVPTDCPQRDERLGWTGDAQVFIRTAAFNMRTWPRFSPNGRTTSTTRPGQGRVTIPSVVPSILDTRRRSGLGGRRGHLPLDGPPLLRRHAATGKPITARSCVSSQYLADDRPRRGHPLLRRRRRTGRGLRRLAGAATAAGRTEGGTPKDI